MSKSILEILDKIILDSVTVQEKCNSESMYDLLENVIDNVELLKLNLKL